MEILYTGLALVLSAVYVFIAIRLASGKKPEKLFSKERRSCRRPKAAR